MTLLRGRLFRVDTRPPIEQPILYSDLRATFPWEEAEAVARAKAQVGLPELPSAQVSARLNRLAPQAPALLFSAQSRRSVSAQPVEQRLHAR